MCHILIIDDHPMVTIGIQAIISRTLENATFYFAYSYQEGADVLATRAMDLVILDLAIPGSIGPEMITAFRKLQKDVKILICSGRNESINAPVYLQQGANGFLHKNSLDSEASLAIKSVLGNRNYISERLKNVMLYNLIEGKPTHADPINSLTRREKQVFNLLLTGKLLKVIAAEMDVTVSTVGTQKSKIFKKLNVENMVELTRRFSGRDQDAIDS